LKSSEIIDSGVKKKGKRGKELAGKNISFFFGGEDRKY
jgi:hypothetical protein